LSRFFEVYADDELHRYLEKDLPLVMGKDRKAHIRLDRGRAVEAHIGLHEEKYLYLQPVPGAGDVFHNDQLVTDRVWIKSGDQTRIGKWVVGYRISGDRVDIVVKPYTGPDGIGNKPSASPAPGRNGQLTEAPVLPVIESSADRPRSRIKRNIIAGFFFLLLVLAALFVLTARSVEVKVDPQPDSLSLKGRLPLLPMGNRYLGVAGTYTLYATRDGYQDLKADVDIGKSESGRYSFTMERLPARLSMTSTPEGAEVFLDGESVGKAPLTELEVSSGPHEILCTLERYQNVKRKIDIPAGAQQSVECVLQPAFGRVFVVTDPAGAKVMDGENRLGITPLTLELDPGEHTLVLQEDGYTPHSLDVIVKADETLTPPLVTLKKQPLQLSIRSTPSGAAVSADGSRLGKTPLHVSWAPATSHQLRFTLDGYRIVEKKVKVSGSRGQEVAVTLEPEPAEVEISVSPQQAQLSIDGKKQKKNSGTFRLAARTHKIEVQARGYEPEQQSVTLRKGERRQLKFTLQKKAIPPPVATAPQTTAPRVPAGKTITVPPVATASKPVQSGSGPEMVRLGPGKFTMGASRREPGRRANEGRHEVEITRPFFLGVHEVSNAEFRRFRSGHRAGNIGGLSLDSDRLPVVKVSWEDAARYCNWLSKQQGLSPFYREQGGTLVPASPATNGFRLPFESEWAFAARMVGRTQPGRYPWNGGFPPRSRNGNYADESARTIVPVVIKGYYDGYPVTAPVESFPRNMGGIFDMGGNVSEWCHDYYSPSPPASGMSVDPTGPATGKFHVVRGSSWRDGAMTELRLSYRGYSNTPKDSLGFRVARYAK
jgi:formylglycine-generating enzyme required for sulfatase activity